jgi:NADH-quinone oxidoreductase subunit A
MSLTDYLPILIMMVLAGAFAILSVFASTRFFAPKNPTAEKLDPYECGIVPEHETAERFPVQFYLIAMVFIAFDIEVIFLYPWAVAMRQLQLFGFIEMLIFVAIIMVAYVYLRREGVFDWAPKARRSREELLARYAADVRAVDAGATDGELESGEAA